MFEHSLKDPVSIKPLETKGRIQALYYNDLGPQYYVRYFYNGQAKNEYFYADELEPVTKQPEQEKS